MGYCKIVAISGAQSSGKSTLIQMMKEKISWDHAFLQNFHTAGTTLDPVVFQSRFIFDDLKAAREVLAEMGKPLYEILENQGLTIQFQEMILLKKYHHDMTVSGPLGEEKKSDSIVIVERCFADLYAFARSWSSRFNNDEYHAWLKHYKDRCVEGNRIYDQIVFLPSGVFEHVDDGIRAKADNQDEVSQNILNFIEKSVGRFPKRQQYEIVRSVDPKERVVEVYDKIKNYFI